MPLRLERVRSGKYVLVFRQAVEIRVAEDGGLHKVYIPRTNLRGTATTQKEAWRLFALVLRRGWENSDENVKALVSRMERRP